MIELTLVRQKSRLAASVEQLRILESGDALPRFTEALSDHGLAPLCAGGIEVLQVNVGKLCNQTCHHCHVDAGPDRRESMSRETAAAVVRVLGASGIPTLDITGGAPEMNPNFRYLVEHARRRGCRVIDRSNLTILLAPGFDDLPGFLAAHEVEIVASLPCYLEENCDRQRGDGVFRRSIAALRRLNELGYGKQGGPLELTLAYNPVGPILPPPQPTLEADYRRELRARYGIEFTRLYTITNMPISRFLDDLLRSGKYDEYMQSLVDAFNPAAADGVMCRTMISVDWQGRLFDCDFNQMLELPVEWKSPQTIHDFDLEGLANRPIATGRHCFGCTAGAGSSCQGSVVKARVGA
jgi:radical SAM/Cys-rich protein